MIADYSRDGWRCDAALAELARQVSGKVCYYVVASVDVIDERFVQRGSAPNFAGQCITLCTCKHAMRAGRSAEAWVGMWVAGFTRKALGHHLIYLMRIGWAFESHRDLAQSSVLPARTKRAKSATIHMDGDLYEYLKGPPLSPTSYKPPHPGHSHADPQSWHRDVGYQGRKRPAALLVGDPAATFIWTHPMITTSDPPHHGHRGPDDAAAFLATLSAGPTRGGDRISRSRASGRLRCGQC